MNIWHDIVDPALITPDRFMAVIEIKRGGKNKYEMDKATGLLSGSRAVLHLDALSGQLRLYPAHLRRRRPARRAGALLEPSSR
ncbi:MAG: hypothetical protein ACLUI3_04965 [Christensenellales bacterium]